MWWMNRDFRELECKYKRAVADLCAAKAELSVAREDRDNERKQAIENLQRNNILLVANEKLNDRVEFAGNWFNDLNDWVNDLHKLVSTMHKEWSSFKDET